MWLARFGTSAAASTYRRQLQGGRALTRSHPGDGLAGMRDRSCRPSHCGTGIDRRLVPGAMGGLGRAEHGTLAPTSHPPTPNIFDAAHVAVRPRLVVSLFSSACRVLARDCRASRHNVGTQAGRRQNPGQWEGPCDPSDCPSSHEPSRSLGEHRLPWVVFDVAACKWQYDRPYTGYRSQNQYWVATKGRCGRCIGAGLSHLQRRDGRSKHHSLIDGVASLTGYSSLHFFN